MFNIKEELDKLPKKPGVYLMHDKDDNIIYVGKAKNLYNRVRSYFRVINGRTLKIEQMISHIDHFEYIVVDSELEAFILENNLIKENNPKYNTLLKDSKTYPYIKVTNEKYPRICMVRKMGRDKARYFGPFVSQFAVKEMIELLNSTYCLRTCNRNLDGKPSDERPCLYLHMHRCMAPCSGEISTEEYQKNVNKAIDFLNGNNKEIIRELKEKMQECSENLEFEEAIRYRDLLDSAVEITKRQKISDNTGFEDKDIIAEFHDETDAVVQVFFVRNGKMIGREHHHIEKVEGLSEEEIISEFIQRYYTGTPFIPGKIMIPVELEDKPLLEEWLSFSKGSSVKILSPKIGDKEKLVELAKNNARLVLTQDKERIINEEKKTKGAVSEIENLLGLSGINRMEAFDISNTNGYQNVGSMVVFEGGKPVKGDYRKFRIKSVEGPDDYSCMYEVLTRRFVHGFEEKKKLASENMDNKFGSFSRFPDLLLMDGGKGQVNMALKVLSELNINIPVCGMVKDDNHRTRGLYLDGQEVSIDHRSEGFKLITRIQDEAHRFAIEYHKSLREKKETHSVFEDIPGVGEARRKALFRAYESVEEMKKASVLELYEKTGIPENVCERIYKYLHPDFE